MRKEAVGEPEEEEKHEDLAMEQEPSLDEKLEDSNVEDVKEAEAKDERPFELFTGNTLKTLLADPNFFIASNSDLFNDYFICRICL